MRLQSKVFIITAIILALHFAVNTYIGQRQIEQDVIANIKDNARTIQGMLIAYSGVYQKIFIEHHIPINDKTINLLPAHAISHISQQFTQWVDNGLSFNTVSDRPRNPNNQADKVELRAIQFFRHTPQLNEHFVSYKTAAGEDFYHFSLPLYIEPLCLKCHGSKTQAPKSIQQRYDTAYDYKLGELRGLISIKLPAKIIKQRTSELLQHNIFIHSLGLFLSFILISLLLNRTIIARIQGLQRGSENLALGNYETQIQLSGNDELTQMAHSFNHMAQMIAHREQQLIRQKSLYYTLSQTNKSIIQLDSTEALLNNICHITTSQDTIILAWFGIVDPSQNSLNIIASAGSESQYLHHINLSLHSDSPQQHNPTNIAFAQQKTSINNHYLNDPLTAFSHKQAQQAGIQSIASFPINRGNQLIALFSVYSDQQNYFTPDIVSLLNEIASDTSYAIQHFDLKAQHIEAQKQLEQSSKELSQLNSKMTMLLESTGEGIFGLDQYGQCTFLNHAAQKMLGYSFSELEGNSMHQLTHHSHSDGRPLLPEECPIYEAFRSGESCQIDNEVFWRKDGSFFAVQYSAYPIYDEQHNITGSVTVFRDTTESRALTKKLDFLASHDSLTSLLNRNSFKQHLEQALASAKTEAKQHVVCYIDLDQFKIINDTCGHIAGDNMLQLIAHILKSIVRENDILARLGGDEFGLLLEQCSIDKAAKITTKICQSIKEFRFVWSDKIFNTGCSIGIAAITENTQSVQSIMSTVDASCYIAKDKGRNQVHISSGDDTETARHQGEMQWVSKIRKALEDDHFILYQQSIMPADQLSKENLHCEILLRMQDSQHNIIQPGAFLPAAERYNLMAELDRWVIHNTFKWLSQQIQQHKAIDFCSINLSGQSIGDKKLYQYIMQQLKKYTISPKIICFEITESSAVTHLEQAVTFIKQLREHGFLFALDDFGTGMSSFAYLKNLPVDFLKIDGSFIKDIIDDPIDRAMVKSINDIGHIMGLRTIAEYVENDDIKNELIHMEVDYLQGYGIAKPIPCKKTLHL